MIRVFKLERFCTCRDGVGGRGKGILRGSNCGFNFWGRDSLGVDSSFEFFIGLVGSFKGKGRKIN